jgi:hypothetical protein
MAIANMRTTLKIYLKTQVTSTNVHFFPCHGVSDMLYLFKQVSVTRPKRGLTNPVVTHIPASAIIRDGEGASIGGES